MEQWLWQSGPMKPRRVFQSCEKLGLLVVDLLPKNSGKRWGLLMATGSNAILPRTRNTQKRIASAIGKK